MFLSSDEGMVPGIDTWNATWTKTVLRDGWWYGIRTAAKVTTSEAEPSDPTPH